MIQIAYILYITTIIEKTRRNISKLHSLIFDAIFKKNIAKSSYTKNHILFIIHLNISQTVGTLYSRKQFLFKSNMSKPIIKPFRLISNYSYLLLVILSLFSCNLKKGMSEICNKEDAFIAYGEFRNQLHNLDKSSTSNLLNNLREWSILEDTVLHYLISDSLTEQSHKIQDMVRCATIRNDITSEINRLVDSQLHTYADIIDIQQSLNGQNLKDKYPNIYKDAECFFNELPAKIHTKKTAYEVITNYANKLLYWQSKGFSSKQDMLEFIKEEDYLFISFLEHIYEYDSKSIHTIIMTTENISKLMFQATSIGNLDIRELQLYMGMRTNRRLMQNATKCADAILSKQVKTPEQAAMTVLMLLNPYFNKNHVCTGIHTKKQIEELHHLGEQISPLINLLKRQGLIKENLIDSLPNKIIKEHILITMK